MTHHQPDDVGSVGTIDRVREEDILLHRAMGHHEAPKAAPPATTSTAGDGLFWPITSIAIATFGTLLYREHNYIMSDQRVLANADRDHMHQTLQKSRAVAAMDMKK
jgi:hypothetical protein